MQFEIYWEMQEKIFRFWLIKSRWFEQLGYFFFFMRSLYILNVLRITAVFISRHLGPVIPTY
jgi:hypothetical protein